MKPLALALAAAVPALLALGVATAASSRLGFGGWPYPEGGTAPQDELLLQAHQRQYSLLLMAAGRGGGAELNGVRVRILGPGAKRRMRCAVRCPCCSARRKCTW